MSEQDPNQHPDIDPAPAGSTPSGPPGSPPKQDWLHTVARATETVAPLVARQAPKADEIPEDRRGRLTTLLAIAGILMAVLQFLVQAYDLVTRPLAPLARALPYVAGGLLAAGGLFGLYTAARAQSRRRRRLALGSTLLVLLAGLSWGGWLAYDYLRPPDGYRILVAEFDGVRAGESIDFGRRIAENLRSRLADSPQPIEIRRTPAVFADADSARREGHNQKAGIVIWGWYDDRGVSPHVEVLTLPHTTAAAVTLPLVFSPASAAALTSASPTAGPGALQPVLRKLTPVTRTPLTLPSLDLFTVHGPDQMAYVAVTVLAMSYLANDDLPRALELFDQAIGSVVDASPAAQGLEEVYYQRAAVLFRLGRFPQAREDLERALALAPDFARAHLLRAVLLANYCTPALDLAGARTAAEQAAALQPQDGPTLQLLADLQLRGGLADEALRSAEASRALDPANLQTHLLLGSIYDALGRSAEARAARETALGLAAAAGGGPPPVPVDALYDLGDALMALDRYDEALAAYREAQNLAPQDLRLHAAKGNALFWQEQLDAAVAEYTLWAQQSPTDAAPHLLLGVVRARQGQAAAAMDHYREAVQLGPCDPTPYLLLGAGESLAGNLQAANAHYARALEIDPQNADALYVAGANNLLLQNNGAAAEQFAALAALEPDLLMAHYYLGEALAGMGQAEKAQAAYGEAVRLGEAAAPTRGLAYAYERLGRIDAAIATYLRLLAEQETPDLHVFLGSLYAEQGANDLARAEYLRAVALDPAHSAAHIALADLAYAEGNMAEAAQEYEAALAQEPSSATHGYAAEAYIASGDLPNALRHLQAAVQLAPDAAEYLAQLAAVANLLNRLDEAGAAAERAWRLLPSDAGILYTRGQVQYKRCDLGAAAASLRKAVELAPGASAYLGSFAGILAADGDMAAVQPLIAELQAAPLDDVLAHYWAGSLLALDDTAAARAELERSLGAPALPPAATAILHYALGRVYSLENDSVRAGAEFAAALAEAPDLVDAEIALGDLALVAADSQTAQAHYTRAAANLPAYAVKYAYDSAALLAPALQVRLALVARQRGDGAAAGAALVEAAGLTAGLRAATPDWSSLLLVEAMLALAEGDEAGAAKAFERALACDQTTGPARKQIETLVAAGS